MCVCDYSRMNMSSGSNTDLSPNVSNRFSLTHMIRDFGWEDEDKR